MVAQWREHSFPTSGGLVGELSLLLVLSFAPRGFSPGISVFPSQKPTFPNSNLIRNDRRRTMMWMSAASKSIFTYFVIYLFI